MSVYESLRRHYRLYAGIGVVVFIVLALLVRTIPADAKVAILDSFFVERNVEVKNDTVTNTIQNLHTHTWSSFGGEVPEGVTVSDVALVLTWSETLDENTVDASIKIPVVTEGFSDEEESSSTTQSGLPIDDDSTETVNENEETVEATSTEETIDVSETAVPDEVVDESPQEENIESSQEATEETSSLPETVDVQTENVEAVEEAPVTFLRMDFSKLFAFVGLIDFAEANTDTSEDISSVSDVPVTEVSETIVEVDDVVEAEEEGGEGDTTTSSSTTESQDVVLPPVYPTLQSASVQYSFDGDSWTNVGSVNLLDGHQATLSLGVDTFASLDSLRVRIVYLAPQDAVPIIFGNAQIQLEYLPLLVEEVIPGPSDQEPNFLVSAVKQDIVKEGARAVLLERGGALELWSGVTDVNDEISTWKRLASGSVLNENTPIEIFNETIFWFDGNGNALLAYDLEKESQIGTAVSSVGDNVFVLMYEDKRQTFLVTYSPETNVFQFEPFSP